MNELLNGLMPGTSAPAKPQIQKLRYEHRAMARLIAENPTISQGELAEVFGYSASWISTIICSDVFQMILAEEMEKSPFGKEYRAAAKTQLEGLLARSMEILRRKLDKEPDQIPDQLAIQTARMAAGALDMGAPKRVSVQETHIYLEQLSENLVGLLRRRRVEAMNEALLIPNPIQGTCKEVPAGE